MSQPRITIGENESSVARWGSMIQISQLYLPVDHAEGDLEAAVCERLRVRSDKIRSLEIRQRAIDARRRRVRLSYTVWVEVEKETKVLTRAAKDTQICLAPEEAYDELPKSMPSAPKMRPIIVGTGPCGLFCGLLLARAGWNPILLERGKAAGDRARDVTGFWRRGWQFDPESNVQFGEGGAGTFSDGKLYTQIRDREHRIPWLLQEMVKAGAPEDILVKNRPHIGTDRLIKVVKHVREEIIALGGEVRFGARVEDVVVEDGVMSAVKLADGNVLESDRIIFAVGHSSRDTFEMLDRRGVPMETKPFSVGVRIEHPQSVVDQALFGEWAGHDRLGSAPYKFVAHCSNDMTAYSFCMCPGGLVVAATSEPDSVVTNGMSSYAREESNANSGFMVEIDPADFGFDGPMGGIEFQRSLERKAFELGGSNYFAPAQRMGDFLAGKASTGPGSVVPSYQPGVTWTDLRKCLPDKVSETLELAVGIIDKSLPGFAMDDAVMTAVETRSSAPIRIPRDAESMECISVGHFYPAGEGAGYAGGIISAAADGMKVAEALLRAACEVE